jgi:hypothetical protein
LAVVDVDGRAVPVVRNAVPGCAHAVGAEDYDGGCEGAAGTVSAVRDGAVPFVVGIIAREDVSDALYFQAMLTSEALTM